MATQLIPLTETGGLPAHIAPYEGGNEFGFSGGGFPTMSLKGKVFTISRNGEKTLVTKPPQPGEQGGDDEPATAIEVVILNSGPKGGKYARTFYEAGYVEGATEKPDCESEDGVAPNSNGKNVQATKCALCPQNVVGSGATSQNPKAKACRSSKKLAIAPAGQLNDPMMLRVPGASLIKLSEYGDFLAKRRIKASDVVTRIGFDYSVAHPALTFKTVGFVTPEMREEIEVQSNAPLVLTMIGEKAAAGVDDAPPVETPAPAPVAPPPPPPAAAKPKPAVKSAPLGAAATAAPPAEAPEPTAPAAPAGKKKVAPPVVAEGTLAAAIDALDFDD